MPVTLFTYPKHAGRVREFDGVIVENVATDKADIVFKKYTADYRKYSDRPYKVGRKSFSSLRNAVKAVANRPE